MSFTISRLRSKMSNLTEFVSKATKQVNPLVDGRIRFKLKGYDLYSGKAYVINQNYFSGESISGISMLVHSSSGNYN
jgi:hypothetical protein